MRVRFCDSCGVAEDVHRTLSPGCQFRPDDGLILLPRSPDRSVPTTAGALLSPPPDLDRELLRALLAEIERYVAAYVFFCDPSSSVPVTLFIPVAYALMAEPTAVPAAPYLRVWSPVPECGKTRLVEVLHKLLGDERAMFVAGSMTPATLYRSREDGPITFLVDEVGRLLGRSDDVAREIAAILDNGYRRGATVPRAVPVGKDFKVRRWSVFGPAVLAGLGEIADSTRSRTIPIVLSRRPPGTPVAPFFEADAEPVAADLRERLGRLAPALAQALLGYRPDLGPLAGLRDRTQEVWWGLLAVAELAGGEWPARARAAALALHGQGADVEPDHRIQLLGALRELFEEAGVDRLPTAEILARLVEREGEPWGRWWGQEVEAARERDRPARRAAGELAAKLKGFARPQVIKLADGSTARGYRREDLEEAWRTYLPGLSDAESENGVPGEDVTDVTDVTPLASEVTWVTSVTSGAGEGLTGADIDNPSEDGACPDCEAES